MRILLIGFVVFAIWSLFSVWLYVDKIRPAMIEPVVVPSIPETLTIVADSVMQQTVLAPGDLTILYEFDNASFDPDPQTDMRTAEFKSWLENNPGSMLSITGHTDNVGTALYNQALGLRRAQTMQKYLESSGVDADKMATCSKGEDEPVAEQATDEGRAKNRRAVLTINK